MDLTFLGSERKKMLPSFPHLAQTRAYWEALRRDGRLPRREEIDPRGLSGALEEVFLAERIAPGHARFRLAGMHLSDLMGMEVRGMPLSALLEPAARARLADALEAVFTVPSVLELWLEAERGIGKPALSGRLILLPVIGSQGEPSLALGCLQTHGSIGRGPRRFAIAGLVREPLVLAEPPRAPAPQPGLAETPADYLPPPPRQVPHLRLVHSRD